MNIKQAIVHLEELKLNFEEFEMVETKEEDVIAFNIAIKSLNSANSLFNYLDNITIKKTTCHCCKQTENLTDVLGMNLCTNCLQDFENYRKMIDKIR